MKKGLLIGVALLATGCNRFGSPMAVSNCTIHSAHPGRSVFTADVQNQKDAPAVAFSIMAARSGRIVIANGDNIVTYDFTRRLASGESAHVELENVYRRMRTVTDCTVAHIDFADGSHWSMPTPEF